MPRDKRVSTSRVIAAEAQAIFDEIADPAMHPVIDGSGSVRETRGRDVPRLEQGSTFGMAMRIGLPYTILNRVVEFEEGRRIAWRHFNGHRWRYELEPADGGTRVTETFDWTTARIPLYIELLGFPRRNLAGMEATLARLEDVVTTHPT